MSRLIKFLWTILLSWNTLFISKDENSFQGSYLLNTSEYYLFLLLLNSKRPSNFKQA
ncbi:MAG: hypothetical protein ACJA01_004285, partial [Saprospiraceae bacterium]